jgi:hypothetical protein
MVALKGMAADYLDRQKRAFHQHPGRAFVKRNIVYGNMPGQIGRQIVSA